MALDDDVLAAIREWVGAKPDDDTLDLAYTRHQSVTRVALEVLRSRQADLLGVPETLRVEGDYAESWGKNLDLLTKQITQLEGLVAIETGVGTMTVARLTRAGRRR